MLLNIGNHCRGLFLAFLDPVQDGEDFIKLLRIGHNQLELLRHGNDTRKQSKSILSRL
jgi:hypothetical protein